MSKTPHVPRKECMRVFPAKALRSVSLHSKHIIQLQPCEAPPVKLEATDVFVRAPAIHVHVSCAYAYARPSARDAAHEAARCLDNADTWHSPRPVVRPPHQSPHRARLTPHPTHCRAVMRRRASSGCSSCKSSSPAMVPPLNCAPSQRALHAAMRRARARQGVPCPAAHRLAVARGRAALPRSLRCRSRRGGRHRSLLRSVRPPAAADPPHVACPPKRACPLRLCAPPRRRRRPTALKCCCSSCRRVCM